MIWRDVPGFEGVYEVSTEQQVRRVSAARRTSAGRLLNPSRHRKGGIVHLTSDGRSLKTTVRKLYRMAFEQGEQACRTDDTPAPSAAY